MLRLLYSIGVVVGGCIVGIILITMLPILLPTACICCVLHYMGHDFKWLEYTHKTIFDKLFKD